MVEPTADGLSLSWAAVDGDVNRYEPIVWDQDTPGAYIDAAATTGTSYTYTGLVSGHRYSTWVSTWAVLPNDQTSGGIPRAALDVIVGGGAPAVPTGFAVSNVDPTTVEMTWDAVDGAAGYSIQYQSLINSSDAGIDGTTTGTSYEIAFLFPGTWHYSFCVHAYNGNLESACTEFITPPVYPGYSKRAELEANGTMSELNVTAPANSTNSTNNIPLGTLWAAYNQMKALPLPLTNSSSIPSSTS